LSIRAFYTGQITAHKRNRENAMKKFALAAPMTALFITLITASPVLAKKAAVPTPSNVSASYQALWQQGNAMEGKAVAKLSKAQGDLSKANRAIAESTSKQAGAASAATVAAADFRTLTAATPAVFNTSVEAQAWAKKVAEGAKRWTEAEKRGAKNGKALEKANKDKINAEASIVKAQSEIEQGRAIQADAQRRSTGL
jgi:hypothetical protein